MRRFGLRGGFGALVAVVALAFGSVGLDGHGARAAIPICAASVAAPSAPLVYSPVKETPPTMANDGRIRFGATLQLVRNHETGEAFLLPTDKELADTVRFEEEDFEQMLHAQREGGVSEKAQEPLRKEFKARQTAALTRVKRERAGAIPLAETLDFTLVRPVYSDFQRIQNEANEFDYTAGSTPQWNESRFRELLMKNGGVEQNGRALSEQDIDRLDPLVAENLGFRLARSLRPDSKRLFFTLPPSTST